MTVLLGECSHFQVLVIEWVTDLSFAHIHLWAIFIVEVQKWRLPVRAKCALSLASTSAGNLPEMLCSAPAERRALVRCFHPTLSCSVTAAEYWYACWCGPVVQACCEEFGWLFCKAFDNRRWFYTSPATVSCICCCCKFGPSDSELYWFTKQWSGLELLPTACAKKFSCTISNCIYFRPVV